LSFLLREGYQDFTVTELRADIVDEQKCFLD